MKKVSIIGTICVCICFILAACGKGVELPTAASSVTSKDAAGKNMAASTAASFKQNSGSIDFFKNGTFLGTLYIVGSCDGSDGVGNVGSKGASGILNSGDRCPGSPFKISASQKNQNTFTITTVIGPAMTNYRTLSVPLDPPGKIFKSFSISDFAYEVGCGNSWETRQGSGAPFGSIPTSCQIPGAGSVGAARTLGPAAWGEISTVPLPSMNGGTRIRRAYKGGDCGSLYFYNHPGTNNIEFGFRDNVEDAITLQKGRTLSCVEEITVI